MATSGMKPSSEHAESHQGPWQGRGVGCRIRRVKPKAPKSGALSPHTDKKYSSISSWSMDFVKKMGITYNESATELNEIFTLLKADTEIVRGEELKVPEFTPQLINIVKDAMKNLTIKTNLLTQKIIHKQLTFCDEAKKNIGGILDNWQFNDIKQTIRLSILAKLASSLHRFIRGYEVFLWLGLEDRSSKLKKQYVDLLKDFTEIFNLKSEDGGSQKLSWVICGRDQTSLPDIRYYKVSPFQATYVIGSVVNGDIKKETRSRTFDINEALSENNLAQHAGDLLMETPMSYFTILRDPEVLMTSDNTALGMICVKTKIIFTYLKLTAAHFDKLQNKDEDEFVEDEDAKILYTRPYDFMDIQDREYIMEFLFWLGFLQDEHSLLC